MRVGVSVRARGEGRGLQSDTGLALKHHERQPDFELVISLPCKTMMKLSTPQSWCEGLEDWTYY